MRDRVVFELNQTRERSDVLSSVEALATLADGPRTWVIGARAEAEKLDQELRNAALLDSDVRAVRTTELSRTTLGSRAVYAQLGYKLTRGLTVMFGVRGELHEHYEGVVAPRLAVAFAPSPGWVLRTSGEREFHAPSAKEWITPPGSTARGITLGSAATGRSCPFPYRRVAEST
jgi:outer membrane receptor for ferrienterochelin and colicins